MLHNNKKGILSWVFLVVNSKKFAGSLEKGALSVLGCKCSLGTIFFPQGKVKLAARWGVGIAVCMFGVYPC